MPKFGYHRVFLDVGFVGEAPSHGFEVMWWLAEIGLELLVGKGLIWVLQWIRSYVGDGMGL